MYNDRKKLFKLAAKIITGVAIGTISSTPLWVPELIGIPKPVNNISILILSVGLCVVSQGLIWAHEGKKNSELRQQGIAAVVIGAWAIFGGVYSWNDNRLSHLPQKPDATSVSPYSLNRPAIEP